MKTLFTAFLIIASLTASAQYCESNRFFATAAGYSTSTGAFLEMGAWPNEDQPWGFMVGIAASNIGSVGKNDGTYMEATAYARLQYRLNRFVQPTVSIGTVDFLNLYAAAGVRLSAPIGRGQRFTLLLEPHYGTRGAGIAAGMAVAIY